ncbi:MAG: F0F1 ATP synthase subunit A [Caldisericia bacterium]|nr:F0F1 ATP synthase subunit A [Caldisericia bacterium]
MSENVKQEKPKVPVFARNSTWLLILLVLGIAYGVASSYVPAMKDYSNLVYVGLIFILFLKVAFDKLTKYMTKVLVFGLFGWAFGLLVVPYIVGLIGGVPVHAEHIAVGPQYTTFTLMGAKLTNTFFAVIISSVIFAAIIIILGLGLRKKGSTLALLAEMLVGSVKGLTSMILGHDGEKYEVIVGTLFGFVVISNLLGIVSSLTAPFYAHVNAKMLIAPTTDLSVTLALALTAVSYFHFQWIKVKGIGNYFKHYLRPTPIMLPINILEEISKPISLAVRLFGNLTGEHIVLEVITSLVAFAVPCIILLLGMFTGFVQALVFTMLFMVYLQPAVSAKGGH